ncbi:ankyrin repeat-containing domain protein [Xylariaceae sp. AK1471]|nr:ankyrin repeat-containing domain protein [Xylariaceae sp. AK1471]
MLTASSVSPGHSSSGSSLNVKEALEHIKTEKESGDPDVNQEPLYVAWASGPRRSPAAITVRRENEPDGAPEASKDTDVVVVFGLFDVSQSPQKPLTWLREYLDQSERDSRIIHFKYHPSQILAPGRSRHGIFTLAELLLCQLTKLRTGGKNRQLVFLAFDIGCIVVKKALTIASQSQSLHGEIFDACRILVFFDCQHRSVNALNMEDKLARLLYKGAESSSSQIRPTIATLPGLAASILEINESFIASRFFIKASLISIYEDATLDFRACQMIEQGVGALGTLFEHRIVCPRIKNWFIPDLLRIFRKLVLRSIPVDETSLSTRFPKWPVERALLSLATPTEPFITGGHIAAPIKLSDTYLKWLDSWGTQILYIYSSEDRDGLVQRTSEHVFLHLVDIRASSERLMLLLYFSFDGFDIGARSLSNMLWTFLAHIISRFPRIRCYLPFMFDRLIEEQACTEADLLGWLEFFVARFYDFRLVINNFDDCPESSRNSFLQLVTRISTKSDKILKVLITSKKPGILQAELSKWPSIDLSTDLNALEEVDKIKSEGNTEMQKTDLISESTLVLQTREAMRLTSSLLGVVDTLAQSILLEQQLERGLTMQEILLEATHGPVEAYSAEVVLDRVLRSLPDQNKTRLAVAFILSECAHCRPKSFQQSSTWGAYGVHLAHQHLEDILRIPEAPGLPRYFWHEVASIAHHDIAHTCLDYLMRSKVKEEQDLLSGQAFAVDSDLGFISYAVKYWPYHLSLAESTSKKAEIEGLRRKLNRLDLKLWSKTSWLLANPFSRSRNPWESPFAALVSLGHSKVLGLSCNSDIASGLEEAARAGNASLVNELLEKREKEHLSQSVLLATIMAASSSGNESLTLELIDRISDDGKEELSRRGKTLLFRAARIGLDRLTEKLLEIGTPVNLEIPYFRGTSTTPLCIASVAGFVSTARVLLKRGANVKFRSHLQSTPLTLAASEGNADIIGCLVKEGKADIEHTDTGDSASSQNPLFIACEWGSPLAVEKLVELGVDPSKPDDNGWSPIIIAATFGQLRSIQILLDHGVNIETAGPGGHETPLQYALAGGHIEAFRRLLEKGANPSSPRFRLPLLVKVTDPRLPISDEERISFAKLLLEHAVDINATDMQGRSALSYACGNAQLDFAKYLLNFNPDINLAAKDGRTALYEAARCQNVPLVTLLLDKGADANLSPSNGNIPLYFSADSAEMTRLLAQRTKNIDTPSDSGITQLMVAASKGWTESVKVLLEHKANVNAVVAKENEWAGWNAVMFAAHFYFADIIMILAEAGADLKSQDATGASALHHIFESPSPAESKLDCLDVLMEFRMRIDIDQVDKDGETVLIRSVKYGHIRSIQKLVRAGASLTRQDCSGNTALGQAVWLGKPDVVQYLLEQGADPNNVGRELGHREGPLSQACQDLEHTIAKMLIDYGADVNCDSASGFGTPLMAVCLPCSDYKEETEKLIQYLLELDADVNAKCRYVGSPLGAAALACPPHIVRTLLDKGASYDIEDDLKRNPIHFAAMNGEDNFRIIEEVGGKPTEVDILGRHALHYAAQGGRLQVVKRIFELLPELDVDTRDIDGWTALCWVARGTTSWVMEHRASEPTDPVNVVRYLLERGADRSVECKIGDKIWSPLQVACYTGAPDEVIALLKYGLKPENPDLQSKGASGIAERTGDPSQQKGKVNKDVICDACFWEIRGFFYECKVCYNWALCTKCYPHRDLVHVFKSPHDFAMEGLESSDSRRASMDASGDDDDASGMTSSSSSSIPGAREDDDHFSTRSTTRGEDEHDDNSSSDAGGSEF